MSTQQLFEVVRSSPGNVGSDERRRWLESAVAKLGLAPEDVVASVLPAAESDDRNERVRALRLLALYADERATAAVLRLMSDPSRRVREVAVASARPHHVGSPAVVDRLRAITEDEGETGRLRRQAFFVLSSGSTQEALPEVAREALEELMSSERFRLPVLVRLCKSSNQTDASRAVLREFVRTGTKEEAVMATRALCGQLLVPVTGWLSADVRQRVRATYDLASEVGSGHHYWIPRDEARALRDDAGVPRQP